jgi:hypothetical protein
MSFGPAIECPSIPTALTVLEQLYSCRTLPDVSWADLRAWADNDTLYISLPLSLVAWVVVSAPLGDFSEDDLRSERMFGAQFCGSTPTFPDMTEGNA